VVFKTTDGLTLKGWLFRTSEKRRGLVVWFHGISNNRASGLWLVDKLGPRGWDLLMYDARAHGDSEGTVCTYGVLERNDLSRALDAVKADKAILFGHSLGAAVALQAAAYDPRVTGVIAVSSFSDLRTAAHERAPFFASESEISQAFAIAEQEGHFRVDDASPVKAAAQIHVPVLVIHGAADRETKPEHSRAIFEALHEPKELVLVDGAGHNDILARAQSWQEIDAWLAARE
jgi:pimeloyl-ACP methyl ester carboxylesterase